MNYFASRAPVEGVPTHAENTLLVATDMLHSLFALMEEGSLNEPVLHRQAPAKSKIRAVT